VSTDNDDELVKLRARVAQLEADADRLNALDLLTHGYGKGWILRESTTNRGMRLHESSHGDAKPTVREAIDDYLLGRPADPQPWTKPVSPTEDEIENAAQAARERGEGW
jgi:hypothetical protein